MIDRSQAPTSQRPSRERRPWWQGLGLTVVSAAMMAVCFPPFNLRSLAWVALVPLLVALRAVPLRWALVFSWLWIVLFASIVGDWLPRAVSTYYQQPWLVGVAFFVGVTTFMGAPYYMVFTVLYRVIGSRFGMLTPLVAAAAWVTGELARGRLLTGSPVFIGNPWGLLGYSQVAVTPLVQVAAWTGIYGVSFVVAAVNAAIAEAWVNRGRSHARQTLCGLLIAAASVAVVLAYGFFALLDNDSIRRGVETQVAVVQANLDLGSTWRSGFYGRNLDVYLDLTRKTITAVQPRIVFWPEGAMTFFLDREPLYQKTIGQVLETGGAELVAGGPHQIDGRPAYFNSVFVLGPDGAIHGRYDKQYLVPFAEYFPFAHLDFLRRSFEQVRVFSPGAEAALLPTVTGPAGVVNCNEAMLPEVVGARVAAGATYIVNPSNDSWLHDRTYSAQQLDIVSMRAVEQRRYLVRASTSGPSAIIDPWGRVVRRSEPLTRDAITGTIRSVTAVSVYGRIGDTFALLCVATALAAALAARRGAR